MIDQRNQLRAFHANRRLRLLDIKQNARIARAGWTTSRNAASRAPRRAGIVKTLPSK
jgi:hypothetical protein